MPQTKTPTGGRKRKPKGPTGYYYLTPKAWRRSCDRSGCDERAVAYRPFDRSYVCESCIERLGINARESKARWRLERRSCGSGPIRAARPQPRPREKSNDQTNHTGASQNQIPKGGT
jgi:hypothetical protein